MIFQKWELVEEGVKKRQVTSNPIMGTISEGMVIVDIYRKKRWNGTWKYKTVVRK